MGAAKLPEKIIERLEEGLQAIIDDRNCHPTIERMKAIPVERKKRQTISDNTRIGPKLSRARKSRLEVAKRLAAPSQIKATKLRIQKLECKIAKDDSSADENRTELERLRAQLKMLEAVPKNQLTTSQKQRRKARKRSRTKQKKLK